MDVAPGLIVPKGLTAQEFDLLVNFINEASPYQISLILSQITYVLTVCGPQYDGAVADIVGAINKLNLSIKESEL